jgi:hypothetical protein
MMNMLQLAVIVRMMDRFSSPMQKRLKGVIELLEFLLGC